LKSQGGAQVEEADKSPMAEDDKMKGR
jgi:hypothetical protein